MSILNFIKNLFRTGSAQQTEPTFTSEPDAFYFHEDNHCQIEYLPKENFNTASKVATEITEHTEKTFDGNGWTDIYIRDEAGVPTKSKDFKISELANHLIEEGFSEYARVTTGYGSAVFPCDNTKAFRKGSIILCIDFKGDTIQNIWHSYSPHEEDHETYKEFLLTMANKYNLLLADWSKSIVVDISSPDEIDKYFVYDE